MGNKLQLQEALSAVAALKAKRVTALKLELECSVRQLDRTKLRRAINALGMDVSDVPQDPVYYCTNCQYWDEEEQQVMDYNDDDGYGYEENGDYCYDCRDDNEYIMEREDLDAQYPHTSIEGLSEYMQFMILWLHRVHAEANREFEFKLSGVIRNSDIVRQEKDFYKSDLVHFAKTYYDGSCGIELTTTIPLNVKNVRQLPMLIRVFKELTLEMALDDMEELPISGAGFHIGLLFSKNMSYPIQYTSFVNEAKLKVLRQAVFKLAPALFILANRHSESGETRPFNYRGPEFNWLLQDYYDAENELIQRASYSSNTKVSQIKYSAINYKQGCMEFRVFDPVFDKPEQVLDNIIIMSKVLHFFDEDESVLSTFKRLSDESYAYSIGDSSDNNLNKWFNDAKVLPTLYMGLSLIKPDYLSIKDIKARVGFTVSKAKLYSDAKSQETQIDQLYELYKQRIEELTEFTKKSRLIGITRDPISYTVTSKEGFKSYFNKSSDNRMYVFDGKEV